MTKIILAENSGFCFGVKRAIKLAESTVLKYGVATTIGPIIHNPQMVESLKNTGVNTVEDIYQISSGPVIIRSHGIPMEMLSELKKKKYEIVDATCPYVAKAHEFAKLSDKENYEIFILGNPSHPEIIALKSYIKSDVFITDGYSDIPDKKLSKVAVICQTTQSHENLWLLIKKLTPICTELRIFNTICNATSVRQDSTRRLAKVSKIMIVIGGKNSSNTLMLAKLCSSYCETKHIETAEEIEFDWFKEMILDDSSLEYNDSNTNIIGLTAGASTPDWIILDIFNKIKEFVEGKNASVKNIDAIPGYKEELNEY